MELSAREDTNRRMLRARDEMDRRYAEPLDVPTLAAIAHLSASPGLLDPATRVTDSPPQDSAFGEAGRVAP